MQIRPYVISIKNFSAVKKLLMERLSAHLFIYTNDIFIANAILRSNEYNNVTRIVGSKIFFKMNKQWKSYLKGYSIISDVFRVEISFNCRVHLLITHFRMNAAGSSKEMSYIIFVLGHVRYKCR